MSLFSNKVREGNKVSSKIIEQNNYRIRETIGTWREALTLAELVAKGYNADRKPLLRLYKDVMLDNHLQSVIELKKDKIMEYPFNITVNGVVNEELTKVISTEWFNKVIGFAIDSMMYGHSLIQIDNYVDGNITDVTLVNRLNVMPEKQLVLLDTNGTETLDYTKEIYYKWLFEITQAKNDLGLLKSVVPLILWKKSAISAWAEYSEVFGMPIRIAKTSSNVREDRERLFNFVRNLGKSAYAVIDSNETIDFIENKKSDAFNVYDKLIDVVNKEVSKLILGVTMLNESGSSRSQSETHAEQSEIKTNSDLRKVEFSINSQVIPKLINIDMLPLGSKFVFDKSKVLAPEEQIKVDMEIHKMYPLDKSYLKDRYGVEFAK